jgi:RimJ/RimL family protein N-acetyltransferase
MTSPCGRAFRAARADDADALLAMFERCSPASRYARFLAPLPRFPSAHLADVTSQVPGRWSWVVTDEPTGRVVGVATLVQTAPHTAEVGILVEDGAQGDGCGTALLRRMARHARAVGIDELVGSCLAVSRHTRRMARRVGRLTTECDGPACELRIALV